MRPGLAPAFKMPRFLRRQVQMELLHALAETFEKVIGLRLILATRHQVIGKPVQGRFTPAVPPPPALAPDISDLVEGDSGKERREYTSYKVANFLVEFSTSIPRTQLRPSYGDGFLGAPLHMVRPPESPPGERRRPAWHDENPDAI
jgi:hypothetical protein